MKYTSRFLLLALAAGISTASAEPWEDYKAAFPAFPCQDGWMACVQEGAVIAPDLQPDGTGMLNPADARVGWFDLTATNNFNPFPELSKYPGKEPRRKGDAAVDAGTDDPDGTDGTDGNEGTDGNQGTDGTDGTDAADNGNDGTANVDPEYVDPEAEMARQEAEEKRVAEAEARAQAEKAAEEERRAKEEEAARMKAADARRLEAEAALNAARQAQDAAEKARLQEEARRAKEAEERARKQAQEAAQLREQREREAEQRRQAEEAARKEREKAEAERKQKEAAERAAADKAQKEEAERRKKAEEEAQRKADEARKAAAAEELRKAQEAQTRAQKLAQEAAKAADAAEKARLQEEQRKAEEAERKAKEEAERKAAEAAQKAKEESERKAREEEEKRKADEAAKKKAEMERLEAEKAAKEEATQPATNAAAGGDGSCDDLVSLETTAILGKLGGPTIQCLEDRLTAAPRMTEKSKISRILMINAFTAGKRQEWAQLMKRHLNEIEQSDPELCYKYALHLSRLGPGSAYGVIKWANTALENRMIWTGSTYESRVYSLYKIRATAAHKIWIDLENKHAAEPTEESSQKVKNARNRTKEFAREWLEYAKAAGKPTDKALDLCMSAAGTKDYCEAG